jgi:hypothetical protein
MTHKIKRAAALAMLAGSTFVAGAARADIVEYNFVATISTEVQLDNTGTFNIVSSSNLLGATVALQDTITGQFFYDTTASTSSAFQMLTPASGSNHVYMNSAAGMQFIDVSGGASYLSNPAGSASLAVWNKDSNVSGADMFALGTTAVTGANGLKSGAAIDLVDGSGSAFQSSQVPTQLNSQQFGSGSLSAYWRTGDGQMLIINANLDTMTPAAAVPEPSSVAMLLAGLGALALVARRRRA